MTTQANTGLSYEAASRRGLALVRQAARTENWFAVLDELVELRQVMRTAPSDDPTARERRAARP